jgi:methyl-accepting chemotaxis protein
MRWFQSLRIEVKFLTAFVVVSAIAAIVGLVGIKNMAVIDERANLMYERELLGLSHAKEANINLLYIARAERNLLLASSEEERQKLNERLGKYESMYRENMSKAEQLFVSRKGKELLEGVNRAWDEYRSSHKQVIGLAMKEGFQEKRASVELAMGPARQKMQVLDDALTALTTHKEENAKRISRETTSIYDSSRNWMILFIAGGVGLGICFGVLLTFGITRPVKRIIEGLSESSEQVAAASTQVSSASQQLAEGTSEQAAALEQTSSSIEEMASMTKQSSGNAIHANQLMLESRTIVEHANQSMESLRATMNEISRASEETQKIVKTIDGIAFQTNLLALNAAVEAARAGEAGASFAVVADEVRNLAVRAAEASKNTAALIEGTVETIREGSFLVEKTHGEFIAVTSIVAKSGELIGEISAATQEQAQGIVQINKAVADMDRVTQQNAANSEESAAASEEMNAQAEQMKEFVDDLVSLLAGTANRRARSGKSTLPVRTASSESVSIRKAVIIES